MYQGCVGEVGVFLELKEEIKTIHFLFVSALLAVILC